MTVDELDVMGMPVRPSKYDSPLIVDADAMGFAFFPAAATVTTPPGVAWAASFTGLGDLPGGSFLSIANGISADGSTVVGGSASANGASEAFRWTSGLGMVGPGDLAGASFSSTASGGFGGGTVAVGSGSSTGLGDLGGGVLRWRPRDRRGCREQ